MSTFPHARRIEGVNRPDLPSLVAMAVAQQSLLPTALAVAMERSATVPAGQCASGIQAYFASERRISGRFASFHPVIAARLLTQEQEV